MKLATVIVNPSAGSSAQFYRDAEKLLEIFAANEIAASILETSSAINSAQELARAATMDSAYVFACGGDGTVHQVVQGLVGTQASLGVLPCGTANALARFLKIPIDPVAALKKLLATPVTSIPVGQARTKSGLRTFAIMAGAGPDGMLAEHVDAKSKRRFGRSAYYGSAGRLFLTRRQQEFEVRFRRTGEQVWHSRKAIAMLVSRLPRLGGMFSGLTPNTKAAEVHLTVQLVAPPYRVSLPTWFLLAQLRLGRLNPWLMTIQADEVECLPISNAAVYTQLDGEKTGELPLHLSISPAKLRLLGVF